VKEVRWRNDYAAAASSWYASREAADEGAADGRIAVIRREIVNGVISYYKEDV
jgi:hypothetical protein